MSAWGFHSGYLACTVFAVGSLVVSKLWGLGICVVAFELFVLMAVKSAQVSKNFSDRIRRCRRRRRRPLPPTTAAATTTAATTHG